MARWDVGEAPVMRSTSAAIAPFAWSFASWSNPRLVPFPPAGFQASGYSHLVRARPPSRFDAERTFQDLAYGHVTQWIWTLDFLLTPVVIISMAVVEPLPLVHQPAINSLIPRVRLIAAILFSLGVGNQIGFVQPPNRAISIPRDRFGP
jgi:hypothetical protein